MKLSNVLNKSFLNVVINVPYDDIPVTFNGDEFDDTETQVDELLDAAFNEEFGGDDTRVTARAAHDLEIDITDSSGDFLSIDSVKVWVMSVVNKINFDSVC